MNRSAVRFAASTLVGAGLVVAGLVRGDLAWATAGAGILGLPGVGAALAVSAPPAGDGERTEGAEGVEVTG